jgi:hypothetical protein
MFVTIVCNLMGYEATPFFIWGMFSEKEVTPAVYEVQKVIINDSLNLDITNGYTPSTRFLLESPLWYFIAIKENNGVDPTITFLQSKLKSKYAFIKPYEHLLFNDSTRINAFIPWYKNYIEGILKIKIDHLRIINASLYYSNDKIILDTTYTVAEWH